MTELEMVDGKYIAVSKDCVNTIFEKFRDEVCPERKGNRWEQVRINALLRDIKWMKLPIEKMNDVVLTKWRDDRLKKVSAATVNREMNLISAVFNHAIKEWKIRMAENPVSLVKRPPKPKHRNRRITDEEYSSLVDYFRGSRRETASWYAGQMFVLGVETAMRLGEMSNLLWADVDLKKRFLTVQDSKNSDSRHVPLSTAAIKLLKETPKTDAFVFPADKDVVGAMFRRGCGALGIEDLHFHDTRHEGVSRLAKIFNVMELAKIIGHRDLKSLMIYYNPTIEDLAGKLD
jgi:integrase